MSGETKETMQEALELRCPSCKITITWGSSKASHIQANQLHFQRFGVRIFRIFLRLCSEFRIFPAFSLYRVRIAGFEIRLTGFIMTSRCDRDAKAISHRNRIAQFAIAKRQRKSQPNRL